MRRRKASDMQVVCYRGETTVMSRYVDASYTFRPWLFMLNPKLLPPGLRKHHRKIIRVNGKRRGYAEYRDGWLPLQRYELNGSGAGVYIKKWIRRNLGFLLRPYEKGYVSIHLCGFRYAVTTAYTEGGFVHCEVYDIDRQYPIGRFDFAQDFSEVYVAANTDGVSNTLQVILGYVADMEVYNSVASDLDKTINITLL